MLHVFLLGRRRSNFVYAYTMYGMYEPRSQVVYTVLRMRVIPRKTWESVHV